MQVAINGLGRVGRQLLRQLQHAPGLELVAVNDLAEPACLAHLVKHDSVHGRADFAVGHSEDSLLLGGRRVPLSREADPDRLPFGALGAQVVLECTGRFATREQAARHLHDGVGLFDAHFQIRKHASHNLIEIHRQERLRLGGDPRKLQ